MMTEQGEAERKNQVDLETDWNLPQVKVHSTYADEGPRFFKPKQLPRMHSESSDEDISMEDLTAEGSASKPLMYPRQRVKQRGVHGNRPWRRVVWSVLYVGLCLASVAACGCLVVYFVNTYNSHSVLDSKHNTGHGVRGCSHIQVEDVWVVGLPKLATESALRLLDVNTDGVHDVIFGFATGAEGYNVPPVVCDIYFNGTHPCQGGVQALDGRSGQLLWRHYTPHEIFAVTCEADLDQDGVGDCIVAGRMATMEAVSGRDGHMLWNFSDVSRVEVMNLYTAQFIEDIDGDGIADILNIHGGDPFGEPGSKTRLPGRLFIFSGRDGSVLRWDQVPDGRESYYSPVLHTRQGNTQYVLFGTGGETHGGSLWCIALSDFYKGHMKKAQAIFTDSHKGVMTPPVLIDLTEDGTKDIVFAAYNSSLLAYDGQTLQLLWNFTYPFSETYATPAPGFYNDDNVADFMISWQYGPGFPVYYHSVVTIVDGKTGKALLQPYVRSTVGAQTSALTISVQGWGNDLYLYWVADCKNHEQEGGRFAFVKGTNVHEKSRSDICKLRFKTSGYSRMYAVSGNLMSPGAVVYDSDSRSEVEHSAWVNTTEEARRFLRHHPEHWLSVQAWQDFIAEHQEQPDRPVEPHPHSTDQSGQYRQLPLQDQQAGYPWQGQAGPQHRPPAGISQVYQPDPDSTDWRPYNNGPVFQQGSGHPQASKSGDYYNSYARPRDDQSQRYQSSVSDSARSYPKRYNDLSDLWGEYSQGHRPRPGEPRHRRHVGPHDQGGLQRLISTGTLAPPLLEQTHPDYPHSMDVVFATYWFYPAKTKVLLPEDQHCLEQKMKQQTARFDPNSKYYQMDDDGYEHAVTQECLELSGHQLPQNATYQSQHNYNPYDVHMGQMTVYRVRVKCGCEPSAETEVTKDTVCSHILPFTDQQWSAYMGHHGNSQWLPRNPANH